MTQPEKVENILYELKKKKISGAQVEKDLGISPGYLWKVKNPDPEWARYTLKEELMKKLEEYHVKFMSGAAVKKKASVDSKPRKKSAPKDSVKPAPKPIIKTPAQVPTKISSKKPELSAYMKSRQKLKSSNK